MKKRLLSGLIVLLFMFGIFVGSASAVEYSYYKVSLLYIGDREAYVNDTETLLDVAPYIKSGRTLVPLRFMENALGAEIKWDGAARTATLTTSDTEVKVTIGSKIAQVDGKAVALDVAAEIKGGRTFVPLRFISENLGATVEYDPDVKSITITYLNTANWKQFTEAANNLVLFYPGDWTVVSSDKANLKLQTPNSSILEFKTETGDLASIIKAKKDSHSTNDWGIMDEGTLDPAAPDNSYYISAMKDSSLDGIEFYTAYIFKYGTAFYTWEITGTFAGTDDLGLFDYIFASM